MTFTRCYIVFQRAFLVYARIVLIKLYPDRVICGMQMIACLFVIQLAAKSPEMSLESGCRMISNVDAFTLVNINYSLLLSVTTVTITKRIVYIIGINIDNPGHIDKSL